MNNFVLKKKEFINDIDSLCTLYAHKSGAKFICVENEDSNRVFSLSFATKPFDNTGVFHIIEHTVLCGSEKYPIHDPFNEMDKGTVNTYLNAITFFDKTVYPIASTNEKDYFNLMKVYCDAVFSPLIAEKKGIFLQEGWHSDGEKINGVVYNEMKGVFAEEREVLEFKVRERLFGDNGYGYYSGGVPENIAELSYEKYLEIYSKYYKPSNCIIYLYGNLDFDKYMKFLDEEYLGKYDHSEVTENYKCIEPFENVVEEVYFSDGSGECMQVSFALGKITDIKEMKALEILGAVLMESEGSPLYSALVDNNLGGDIEYDVCGDMFQPSFNIYVMGTEEKSTSKFRKIIEDTLNKLYKDGIDKKLIASAVNRNVFGLKEEEFGYKPKGLYYNLELLEYFIYGKEDFEGIKYGSLYDVDYDYKALLKKYFIDNKSCVYGILKHKDRKNDAKNSVPEKNTDELIKYQKSQDSEEDIAKIPCIDVKDISRYNEKIETEIYNNKGIVHIFTPIEKDIVYFTVLFDTSFVPYRLKKYINIFVELTALMDTKNYSYQQLDNNIDYYLGGLQVYYTSLNMENGFFPAVVFEGKALETRCDNLIELLIEVIENTVYDNVERIKNILDSARIRFETSFISDGEVYSSNYGSMAYSKRARYDDAIEGIGAYRELCSVLNELDSNPEKVIKNINETRDHIIARKNMHISVSARDRTRKKAERLFETYTDSIKEESGKKIFTNVNLNDFGNTHFLIDGDTCFNSKVYKIDVKNRNFGHLRLINKIVNSDYLWKKVRGECGAYGSSNTIDRNGIIIANSYRDNCIDKTYNVFDGIYDYLLNNIPGKKELEKYKIGALSAMSKPIKNSKRGDIALARYFQGITEDMLDMERMALIDACCNDIVKNAEIFNVKCEDAALCTFSGVGFRVKNNIFDYRIEL